MYDFNNILNESDVEQKFIVPILTSSYPQGLGFSSFDYRTKPDLKKIKINKGKSEKLYFPDYVIVLSGIPIAIIEAKEPNDDNLEEALREARLYATELNTSFSTKLNPCKYIISTNSKRTIIGLWDENLPRIEFKLEDVNTSNTKFNDFINLINKEKLSNEVNEVRKKLLGNPSFLKPVHLLGGRSTQEELIDQNSFGANLSLDYKYLFNPESKEEKKQIVENAYVKSKKRESHIQPVDKLIRRIVHPVMNGTKEIKDTKDPKAIFDIFKDIKKYKNELCLLIGSVGSGKSTFIDYLKEVAIDKTLREKTEWISVNLNNAPVSENEIYKWIVDQIINEIKILNPKFDFDELSFIKKVFSTDIDKIIKGPLSLYPKDSEKYIDGLYNEITKLHQDKIKFLQELIKFLYVKNNKLLVTVLDNCDKRNKDSQLLLFEVANWIKSSFHTMTFLPIRETTYDKYRNFPPLDTVINDLVFRIDPPLLDKVLYERLKYALREISQDTTQFSYYLENNIRINCDREEVGFYLKSLIKSIFQNNFLRRVFVGLTGRNIRKGLEVFLNICKSGYITTDLITRIKESSGDINLPNHLIMNILLRNTRRYYNDDNSLIKNLFHSYKNDIIPDPFVRFSILRYLKMNERKTDIVGNIGFHKISKIIKDLKSIGHDEFRIVEEINSLEKAECIITESQNNDIIEVSDHIKLTSNGEIHLDLLKNLDYLAAISEDTWYRNTEYAKKIMYNITGSANKNLNTYQQSIDNSLYLINYLKEYKNYIFNESDKFMNEDFKELVFNNELEDYIAKKIKEDIGYLNYEQLQEECPEGSIHKGRVNNVKDYGAFFSFNDNKCIGYISSNNIDEEKYGNIKIGNEYDLEVIDFSYEHKKFTVKLV